ncbi:MAG: hypothetical protein CVT96_09605 [Bacteroidetes bacterium HGW-Bacteroidetes-13]|nr:MAG: hypothetical protein CVT96_09605 [Bacteroidetes bacterium HGW-Bacteroidetes-13]
MKNFNEVFLILFYFLIISSVNAQRLDVEKELFKCINDTLGIQIENANGIKDFNYVDLIKKLEQLYLQHGLIQKNDRENYIDALKSLTNEKPIDIELEIYKKQEEIFDKTGFLKFSTYTIFESCPYYISVNKSNDIEKIIYNQGVLLNRMFENGLNNIELLKEFIEATDEKQFSELVFRSPTILLVAINLDFKYNEKTKKFIKVKID